MLGPCHNNHCGQPSDGMRNPENCQESPECVSRCTAYGNVCPCSARAAGQAAHKKMESIICNSKVFAQGKPQFRSVDASEIIMGEKLGEGGFSMVHSCSLKDAPLDESCAIKYLKRRVMVEQRCFEHGAADLATEAFFLARLDHPNIVKLHAVTAGSVESNISIGKDVSFFIVLDRLVETLETRIDRWRSKAEEMPNSLFYRMSKDYKETQKAMLKERLQIALEIATVMEYLHNLNILVRDLKPDNIGFDQKGTLKLFDFGLAKEEKAADALEDGKYKMTGHTGSRRYMAPEGMFALVARFTAILIETDLTFCFLFLLQWQQINRMTSL
jgi:serine/threonine protein kinase